MMLALGIFALLAVAAAVWFGRGFIQGWLARDTAQVFVADLNETA